MKKNPLTLLVGAILILLFGLLLFVFQVRQTEVAVVTTFGRVSRTITTPGAYLKLPWPIQKEHKFDQRIYDYESAFEQVLTPDGYNLLIKVYAGWSISEPKQFFPRFGSSIVRAQESIEILVRNAYSGVVGSHPFSHFISTDPKELKFNEIEKEMLDRIRDDAQKRNYGIDVKFFGIQRLGLPENVTELVFERMKSERQVLENKIKFEGERDASAIRSSADLESARLLTDAEVEAKQIIGEGEREAAQHFAVFEQEPQLALYLLNIDALRALLKERATLVLDLETPPLNLLKPNQAPSSSSLALPSPVGETNGARFGSKKP
jgi:modulator of FtsH protease HflC